MSLTSKPRRRKAQGSYALPCQSRRASCISSLSDSHRSRAFFLVASLALSPRTPLQPPTGGSGSRTPRVRPVGRTVGRAVDRSTGRAVSRAVGRAEGSTDRSVGRSGGRAVRRWGGPSDRRTAARCRTTGWSFGWSLDEVAWPQKLQMCQRTCGRRSISDPLADPLARQHPEGHLDAVPRPSDLILGHCGCRGTHLRSSVDARRTPPDFPKPQNNETVWARIWPQAPTPSSPLPPPSLPLHPPSIPPPVYPMWARFGPVLPAIGRHRPDFGRPLLERDTAPSPASRGLRPALGRQRAAAAPRPALGRRRHLGPLGAVSVRCDMTSPGRLSMPSETHPESTSRAACQASRRLPRHINQMFFVPSRSSCSSHILSFMTSAVR